MRKLYENYEPQGEYHFINAVLNQKVQLFIFIDEDDVSDDGTIAYVYTLDPNHDAQCQVHPDSETIPYVSEQPFKHSFCEECFEMAVDAPHNEIIYV